MSGLFSSNSKFNGDISLWNVSNVTDMSYMFYESNFNGNLYNWDVSNVKNMQFMFCKNPRFNTDISRWDITVAFELAYDDIHYPFPTKYTNGGNGIFHAFDNVPKNNLPHKCIQAYNWILNERAKQHKLTESTNRDT
jgi:surface protein